MSPSATAYVRESVSMIAGAILLLAVEVWALFDLGFIRLKDPQAAERAVQAAYWDEVYSTIAAKGGEE